MRLLRKQKAAAPHPDNQKLPGKTEKKTDEKTGVKSILSEAPRLDFPDNLRPMLATLVDKPVDEDGWVYEVKWDGYRALSFLQKKNVEIKSRNNKSFNDKFYPVTNALKKWNINAIVDGEIVVLNENGLADFSGLQNWRSEADGELMYYVFDLLWYEGKDLTGLSLLQRREVLRSTVPSSGLIRLSENFEASGHEFLETAKNIGFEGIIAKRAESEYLPGRRSTDWLKIKANKRQEMIIGGYTKNEGSGKLFSSLLVGVFENGKLVYTGKVGTGFTEKLQQEMMKQFKPLVTKKNPFDILPDINKPSRFRPNPPKATATFLKPVLVCEVSYTEMTSDGIMRHPSFEGMRADKNVKDVVRETEASASKIVKSKKALEEKKIIAPTGKKTRKTLLNPKEETQVRIVDGHELKFTNLSKIFWPKEKHTKRDLINYYYQVAPYMLPYLKDRPQSMNRHPHGINGESFYFKDVTGKAPEWIETHKYYSETDGRTKNYLVCTNEASLLYMVSLGCIEINPWSSTTQNPDHPDWCIIDLDPGKTTFNQVIKAAQVTKEVLDMLGVPAYCKTSGSKGLHIYIPLGAKYTYEQSKEFARAIVKLVHKEIPKFTSIERMVSRRGGKMYLDFLQNRFQATLAAPYSVRPKPGATVSMPLYWDEVKTGLKMSDFTIQNALERIKSEGDIFKPVLGKGVNIGKIMKSFGIKI